ncbi:MAG: hypothetical protein RMM17_05725 [Acidobacteriota bacterium]|nr:hypothetical protein [Blastocatellia bacterium]MDW8412165.1 hypothetical protein [Acidobacteriota bacterium]
MRRIQAEALRRQGKILRFSVSPKYIDTIRILEEHNLLPAIVFIGSRRGCDEAAQRFLVSSLSDLAGCVREKILAVLTEFDPVEAQYIRSHRHFQVLLLKGVAAHHAGHLPTWKHFVETLMSRGLLRAVFATTTLAAGVDMPARTVVITASSIRDDEGHRDLRAFELAQMTGRAGRRGRDNVGFAIFIPGPFQDIQLISGLLDSPPEPIESTFTANYTMVLNLLQQHAVDSARELVERSFGQYQRLKKRSQLLPESERLRRLLEDDSNGRPCSDRISTWSEYRATQQEISLVKAEVRRARKQVKLAAAIGICQEEIESLRSKLQTLQDKADKFLCNTCPQLQKCARRVAVLKRARREFASVELKLRELEHGLWERFLDCATLLRQYGYLDEDLRPTADGVWAARLRVENTLFVAELVRTGYFSTSDPRLLAALTGAIAASDQEIAMRYVETDKLIPYYRNALTMAVAIARKISQEEYKAGLCSPTPIVIDGNAARLLLFWADEQVKWSDLLRYVIADEGDVVRLILRTSDILGQLVHLKATHPTIADLAREAIRLIRRPPVED